MASIKRESHCIVTSRFNPYYLDLWSNTFYITGYSIV